MVAETRVKASITQNACDMMNAIGNHAVALTKGELVNVVEVDNGTLRIERRCDDTLAAKNKGSSESLVQHVKVSHTIEQRQHHGLGPNCCREGVHGPLKIVGFATQQDEVEGVTDILREDRCGLSKGDIPMRTLYD